MNSKLTVTIAVLAYNEAINITNLLHALVQQRREGYSLEQILVVDDGSTDETRKMARKFSQKKSFVRVQSDHKRMGVRARIQQVIRTCKTDVLIIFDGDTLPKSPTTIQKLAAAFGDSSLYLATARLEPVHATTLFEYFLYSWRLLWGAITQGWKSGNNIYQFRGAGIALRLNWAKNINIPKKLIGASSYYFFLTAQKQRKMTRFVRDAVILYRLPTNRNDYIQQSTRGDGDAAILQSFFGEQYKKSLRIPRLSMLLSIAGYIVYNPIHCVFGLLFRFHESHIKSDNTRINESPAWESVRTTKRIHTTT